MEHSSLYKDLTDSEFKVYTFIKDYQDGRKTFFPNVEYIGEHTGKDKRTVQRAMAGLREKGVIA